MKASAIESSEVNHRLYYAERAHPYSICNDK